MILSLEQLIGLKVKTRSGRPLGRVKSFKIEAETGQISQYLVTDEGWLPRLLSQDLLISRSQVVQITEEEMIVEDGLAGIKERVKEAAI